MEDNNDYIKEVGKLAPSNKCFDLGVYANYGKLDGISIRYTDKAVVGMELSYGGTWTGEFSTGGKVDNTKIEKFIIDKDDAILSIQVCCYEGNQVAGLCLSTNKHNYEVGNMSGNKITLSKPGCEIKSFKVGFSINSLCYIQPIYSEDLFELDKEDMKITYLFGTWYQESEKLDNIYESTYGKLKELKIYSDDYVKGYELIYENKVVQVCNIFPAVNNKVKVKSLKLAPDEEVDKIYIRGGSVIDHLSFITNKGNIVSGGAVSGVGKVYKKPLGYKFIGFDGGLQNNLHYLRLKFIKN
jgi:hypothetical protein